MQVVGIHNKRTET